MQLPSCSCICGCVGWVVVVSFVDRDVDWIVVFAVVVWSVASCVDVVVVTIVTIVAVFVGFTGVGCVVGADVVIVVVVYGGGCGVVVRAGSIVSSLSLASSVVACMVGLPLP